MSRPRSVCVMSSPPRLFQSEIATRSRELLLLTCPCYTVQYSSPLYDSTVPTLVYLSVRGGRIHVEVGGGVGALGSALTPTDLLGDNVPQFGVTLDPMWVLATPSSLNHMMVLHSKHGRKSLLLPAYCEQKTRAKYPSSPGRFPLHIQYCTAAHRAGGYSATEPSPHILSKFIHLP